MSNIYVLMVAQFLTAFADNAILFTVIAMALQVGTADSWYIPALQSVFLLAAVFFAPWVGHFADAWSKPKVLLVGNLLKLIGAAMILVNMEPLFAYAVVGAGAAVYGPAKYGILPEMVSGDQLVKANGLIEASTIVAIILGTLVGGKVADSSIDMALVIIIIAFALSIVVALKLPKLAARGAEGNPVKTFSTRTLTFLSTSRARFSVLGASLFWGSASVLRVALVGWAALMLGISSSAEIGELTLWLALGIVVGAAVAPKLVPGGMLRRARMAAYCMGAFIVIFSWMNDVTMVSIMLALIGLVGGIFVVPVNAALQEIGHQGIGAGGAVAIQGFFENLAMLVGVGLYTWGMTIGADPVAAVMVLGILVMLATLIIAWRLPALPEPWPIEQPVARP